MAAEAVSYTHLDVYKRQILRFEQIDNHIGTYPVPFSLFARTLNPHLSLEMFDFAHTGLAEEINNFIRSHIG